MSIVAKPDRWMTGADIMTDDTTGELKPLIYGPELGECMMRCRAINPKSLDGRTVYVYLSQRDVTEVLLALREIARDARSRTMESGHGD